MNSTTARPVGVRERGTFVEVVVPVVAGEVRRKRFENSGSRLICIVSDGLEVESAEGLIMPFNGGVYTYVCS